MVCTNLERDCIHLQIHSPNMIYKVHFSATEASKYVYFAQKSRRRKYVSSQKLSQTHFYTFTTPIWLFFAITLSAPTHETVINLNFSTNMHIFMSHDEFFFSKKTCKMKTGRVTNMILPWVLCSFAFLWKLTTFFHRWFFYVL